VSSIALLATVSRVLFLIASVRKFVTVFICNVQGDHLSGKPRNVRAFDSCQGNVRDFTKSKLNVREKCCPGKVA